MSKKWSDDLICCDSTDKSQSKFENVKVIIISTRRGLKVNSVT